LLKKSKKPAAATDPEIGEPSERVEIIHMPLRAISNRLDFPQRERYLGGEAVTSSINLKVEESKEENEQS